MIFATEFSVLTSQELAALRVLVKTRIKRLQNESGRTTGLDSPEFWERILAKVSND